MLLHKVDHSSIVVSSMDILKSAVICYLSVVLLLIPEACQSANMLTPDRPMSGNQTLVSAGEKFELGFFSPGNSTNRYLGIWFYGIPVQTVVWVANRDDPIGDSPAVLKIGTDGNLLLVDMKEERTIWSSNNTNANSTSGSTVAQLLDSGNLVLRDQTNNSIWQSFDHPSDTLLAGMKLGWDLRVSLDRYLTSWKSKDDPSTGDLTYGFDLTTGLTQKFLRKGSVAVQRSGPWEGTRFSGLNMDPLSPIRPEFFSNPQEVYYMYEVSDDSVRTMAVLSYTGSLLHCLWSDEDRDWKTIYSLPNDACDVYGKCGPNSLCTISNPRICSCLTGYQPKSTIDWDTLSWSDGCIRKDPLNCTEKEGFKELKGVKVPDMLKYWINTNMSLDDCRTECLRNCSCTAYSNTDITGTGSGCLLWYGDLIDIRQLNEYSSNQRIFIRVSALDIAHSNRKVWSVAAGLTGFVCLATILVLIVWRRRRNTRGRALDVESKNENVELPIMEFMMIVKATNNFSNSNKIGEGGFGPVYKGHLHDGQEIAVKRLSEDSRQGSDEFKNEVVFIARLQHRNLVKLLGCCIHGEERMLIYEYMPNGSLDSYIFGNTESNSLVWKRRFDIIVGVARGILYLHRDSRLRIVHRDLKASNVLLDSEMNPKISDFGMARAVGSDQLLEKTKRVVGTYGYMSPEYAIDGIFSTKSDVFSFGVLVLEIVSGKKNRVFHHPDHNFNLLGHAWRLWLEGRDYELIDEQMEDTFSISEVRRCIQIGLLCVQTSPEDRPTMSSVLLMLDSQNALLPQPKQPGFFAERSHDQMDISNQVTITLLEGR